MTETARAKRALRKHMLQARGAVDATRRDAWSRAAAAHLLAHPTYAAAATVMAFASMGAECNTWPLLARILADGKRLLLPRCRPRAAGFDAVAVADLDADLVPGPLPGMRDPAPHLPVHAPPPDLVIVPGLAFDRAHRRLGYGKGMYDAFLTHHAPKAVTVGLGFALQLVDRVPTAAHDVPLTHVLTEQGFC